MPIGSGQRDSRRRRVLLDDKQDEGTAAKSRKRAKSSADDPATPEKLYTEAALVDHHLPISSMVPKKFWVLALIAVGLTVIVVSLNLLDGCCQQWSERYGAQQVMAFDMIAGKGIVKWLSSFLLAVAALYCVQIYLIRRHRNDDYRGSYRIWGWLAACLLLLSLNATAGVSELFLNLIRDFARDKTGFNNPIVWTAIILLPITICLLRVMVDIRESKGAVAALILAAGAFILAMLLKNDVLKLEFAPNANSRIVHCNLILIGYISLFLSSAVFSRFVFMDSQGLLAGRSQKRAERVAAREEKRKLADAAKAEKLEARQLEKEIKREESAARASERKRQKTEKSGTKENATAESRGKSQEKGQDKGKASGPLTSRTQSRSRSKTKQTADPERMIPDFKEVSDDKKQRSTISIEEMQQKMAASKNRSERKRLRKMIEAQQRQQSRAA